MRASESGREKGPMALSAPAHEAGRAGSERPSMRPNHSTLDDE